MFAQVDKITGTILATTSMPIDEEALAGVGRLQFEIAPGVDGSTHCFDLAQDPPALLALPADGA